MMKNFHVASIAAMLIATAPISMAETVKKEMPACISEDLLDELTTYAVKKDMNGFRQLLASGQCIGLPLGATVSVISPGFMVATIRYKGVKLFTASESIR